MIQEERIIENPIVKDKVHFLFTNADTNSAYTLIFIELAPKGENTEHYHDTFEEEFEAVEGDLTVVVEGRTLVLKPGEKYKVERNKVHAFYNKTDEHIKFKVKITPSSRYFEQFLQILYGLAQDGKTNKKGIPTNIWDIAAISLLSETYPPKGSFLDRIAFIIRWLSKRAEKNGRLEELIKRYVKF